MSSCITNLSRNIIATPGTESNVKEIYDKVAEIRATRPEAVIFNQFDELGNHLWHYTVTGRAMEELFNDVKGARDRFAGVVVTSGSAGTTASGDYLREVFPTFRFGVGEALQCPTLLLNGFGDHRIEGIGDKHVPWVHNVKNTDVVFAIDDSVCMAMIRICNEPEGQKYLRSIGVKKADIERLNLMGISGVDIILFNMAKGRHSLHSAKRGNHGSYRATRSGKHLFCKKHESFQYTVCSL